MVSLVQGQMWCRACHSTGVWNRCQPVNVSSVQTLIPVHMVHWVLFPPVWELLISQQVWQPEKLWFKVPSAIKVRTDRKTGSLCQRKRCYYPHHRQDRCRWRYYTNLWSLSAMVSQYLTMDDRFTHGKHGD